MDIKGHEKSALKSIELGTVFGGICIIFAEVSGILWTNEFNFFAGLSAIYSGCTGVMSALMFMFAESDIRAIKRLRKPKPPT